MIEQIKQTVGMSSFLHSAGRISVTNPNYDFNGMTRSKKIQPRILLQYTLAGVGMIEFFENKEVKRYELKAGDAFLVAFPSPHRYWYPGGKEPWDFCFASFRLQPGMDLAHKLMEQLGPIHSMNRECDLIKFVMKMGALVDTHGKMIDPYLRFAYGYRFFIELCRHFDPTISKQKDHADVMRVIAFINDSLHRPISLEDMCQSAGVSSSTILRSFRKCMGTTPVGYLIEQRIERAKRLLLEKQLPVGAIAEECGFSTATYFCHVFHERVGMTPAEYRRHGDFDD